MSLFEQKKKIFMQRIINIIISAVVIPNEPYQR